MPDSLGHEDEFPAGHPERRQVSNAMLAFQIATLQESSTAQGALIREALKDLKQEVTTRLDKHDSLLIEIQTHQARMDERTSALEAWRHEQETLAAKAAERSLLELATARVGASENQINKRVWALAYGLIVALVAALTLYGLVKGFN